MLERAQREGGATSERPAAGGRPVTEDELRHHVATSCRILFRLGLADYMGHPSARVPGTDRVIIKPVHSESVRGMHELTAEQMTVIDLNGNVLEGDNPPPKERYIHTGIYRARPDVLGIVHTHQMMATLFGVVDRPIEPILHVEAPLVAGGIPTYPSPELITSPELGDAVAAALGNARVGHLRGHGIISVGDSVQEATIGAILLERLARANYIAAQLGTPRVITPDEVETLGKQMVGWGVRWAYYSSLTENDASILSTF